MNKSIKVIEDVMSSIMCGSRVPYNEPFFRHYHKMPKNVLEKLSSVNSQELANVRIDSVIYFGDKKMTY